MNLAIVEQIAKQLHKEYRAAFKSQHSGTGTFMGVGRITNKTGSGCRNEHDHGWDSCHHKPYFLKRAGRLELDIKCLVVQDEDVLQALNQLDGARNLLQRIILGYCKESRQQTAKIFQLTRLVEAATAAGISFDVAGNASNKLAEKRPTRIIKLPNTTFSTMKVTKCPDAQESVADATGC